jgi:DNA-binding response OmpR family regulator
VLTVDDLKLDRVERKVERAGCRIDLTSKEFALLDGRLWLIPSHRQQ